jgi:hypothetical protein
MFPAIIWQTERLKMVKLGVRVSTIKAPMVNVTFPDRAKPLVSADVTIHFDRHKTNAPIYTLSNSSISNVVRVL